MSTTDKATSNTLPDWLTSQGFHFEGIKGQYGTWWFRKGQVRVTIEDEACISIFVFDARPQYRKADLLSWQASLTDAPMLAATALITNALGCVRAEMLPQN